MALSFEQQSQRAAHPEFRAIVDAVIAREILAILDESPATPNYTVRRILALRMCEVTGNAYNNLFYAFMAANISIRGEDNMDDIVEGAWTAAFGAVFAALASTVS